ncbi:MAG: ATP-dependent helicase HrpB [Alphaproteobacteria bacterium]
MPGLPVAAALPAVLDALARGRSVVLEAPPGAGKTTLVPPALLGAPWLAGAKVLLLQPRRIAARAAARRMAALVGEPVGGLVGHRVRLDTNVGPRTRIEAVTTGVFLRQIQHDPGLDGVGAVIFDEFHERSVEADLALALAIEARAALRPDLRLVVMSATLDGGPVAGLLGDGERIAAEGRQYPVTVHHADRPVAIPREIRAAEIGRRALAEADGDVLVFLPGMAEIRRAERHLAAIIDDPAIRIAPLHGDLPGPAQDRAIAPGRPDERKIVLATSIAETSLTIEGVTTVVDAGLKRVPRFDPATGMTRLATVPVSIAAAEQRRGRAGRLGPGTCHRLWTAAEHRGLIPFDPPEILAADLAPLVLELALWGARDPRRLAWLDPPPTAALGQAHEILRRLGALDADGIPTAAGRRMGQLGIHPRLARMAIEAEARGAGWTGCLLAALLSERDPLRSGAGARDADLRSRLALLAEPDRSGGGDSASLRRIELSARDLARSLGVRPRAGGVQEAGPLVAAAYPDRIGRRADPRGIYPLAGGGAGMLADGDALVVEEWLAIAALDGDRQRARIHLAAPLARADIEAAFADRIETVDRIAWDARSQSVLARRERRLDRLLLEDAPLPDPDPAAVRSAMAAGIRALGLAVLPWTREREQLRARIALLRGIDGADRWPDTGEAALLATLEDWLGPHLAGITRPAGLARLDLAAILMAPLDWDQRRRLEIEAPTHVTVPTGSRIALDYASGDAPVLAVRLQEMFGARETPAVAGGRVPVVLHLLSPAGRPVQVTRDLAGFWARGYGAVRADLRGRYPKHFWPDDPASAPPTRRTRPPGAAPVSRR